MMKRKTKAREGGLGNTIGRPGSPRKIKGQDEMGERYRQGTV